MVLHVWSALHNDRTNMTTAVGVKAGEAARVVVQLLLQPGPGRQLPTTTQGKVLVTVKLITKI